MRSATREGVHDKIERRRQEYEGYLVLNERLKKTKGKGESTVSGHRGEEESESIFSKIAPTLFLRRSRKFPSSFSSLPICKKGLLC